MRLTREAVSYTHLVEDLLLGVAEELGQDTVRDDTSEMNRRLARQSRGEVDRFGDGHLLRRRHQDRPGPGRVAEDLQYPVGLAADHAHADQLVDAGRGRKLSDDVPRRRRVHHHEVVVTRPDLEAQLADGQNLPYPWCRGRHEIEGASDRADPPDGRNLRDGSQVFPQCRLGVHRHRHETIADAPARERRRPALCLLYTSRCV